MKSLANARRSVSARLQSVEIPLAFQLSTIAAASNAYERRTVAAKVSRRRLMAKVERLGRAAP